MLTGAQMPDAYASGTQRPNNYKVQHVGKMKLRKGKSLLKAIRCSDEALQIANAHFNGEVPDELNKDLPLQLEAEHIIINW